MGDGKQYMQTRIDEGHYALVFPALLYYVSVCVCPFSVVGKFAIALVAVARSPDTFSFLCASPFWENPPTWINGAILEIMTISKSKVCKNEAGEQSHEHKIDLGWDNSG